MAVWVADHGTHPELSVVSMHSTAELAADRIRRRFRAPFEIEWEPVEYSPDGKAAVLTGAAAPGPGFPHGYLAVVLLQRWEVDAEG